jgi:hypothetical protein
MRRGGFPRPAHETALSLFERVCCASVPVGPFVRSHRAFPHPSPHPSEGRRAAVVGVIQAAHEIGRQGRRRAYVAGAVRVSQAPLSLMSSIGSRAREATRSDVQRSPCWPLSTACVHPHNQGPADRRRRSDARIAEISASSKFDGVLAQFPSGGWWSAWTSAFSMLDVSFVRWATLSLRLASL